MFPKFSNEENPRQLSVKAIECGSGITVSCVEDDCNVIKLTDSQGTEKLLFKCPIQVRVKNKAEKCAPSDYRRESPNLQPEVVILGMDADNGENYFKPFVYSLMPQEGQSVEELAQSIKDAICACSACDCPEPIIPESESFFQEATNTIFGPVNAWQLRVGIDVDVKVGDKIKIDALSQMYLADAIPSGSAQAELRIGATSGTITLYMGATYNTVADVRTVAKEWISDEEGTVKVEIYVKQATSTSGTFFKSEYASILVEKK